MQSSTILLNNATTGGRWSSVNTAIATVGSASGVVAGLLPGIDTIVYTVDTNTVIHVITIAAPTVSVSGSSNVCAGSCDTLTAATSGNFPVVWYPAASLSCLACDTTISCTPATQNYMATIMDNNGCTDTAAFSVAVHPLPGPISGGSGSLCLGDTLSLADTTSGGTWSSGSTPVASIGSVSGLVTGTLAGTAVITYLSPAGCTTSITITVDPCVTGITAISPANTISIFPNPATTCLAVSAPDKITTIAITNLLGKAMLNQEYNTNKVQINVAALPQGIYLIKINGNEVRKFVKE